MKETQIDSIEDTEAGGGRAGGTFFSSGFLIFHDISARWVGLLGAPPSFSLIQVLEKTKEAIFPSTETSNQLGGL